MKKRIIGLLLFVAALALAGCSRTEDVSVMDGIKNSPVARMELPDGRTAYVDGEISSLKTLADLDITESPIEPSDTEADWIYRIVFNPSDRVKNAEEITVSFHKDYIQIDLEYYTASDSTSYEEILEEWARPKFNEFMALL